ncbi:DUF5683 domain-containing protein [Flavihumibacter rivuli]|uniref:DUF5683 domain-containing protein n=1 Tax=Flavihumibacter rivuli TaxID=2838156 RepID=UPI001BDF424C|nr:DUF5683 domain-containing protein [Flavihumibacter rivuli]ULQ57073.1 DUF5683 domain-containing protein [Flavihumibacter rivuli]
MRRFLFTIILLTGCFLASLAQQDSSVRTSPAATATIAPMDTAVKKPHSPKKAAIRSAILPGWGQAYNRKYWKIPIVYTALGITGYLIYDNIQTYNEVNFAYKVLVNNDTANYENVADYLKPFVKAGAENSLSNYRAEYRKNIDYSVLFFLLFWGLNVLDASVDAHLKDFDVSPNLSMRIKPMIPATPSGGNMAGIGLVFDIHKAKPRQVVTFTR